MSSSGRHWTTGRAQNLGTLSAGWIYGVIQHIPAKQPQIPFLNQNSKRHDLLLARVIPFSVLSLLFLKQHAALTTAIFGGGRRKEAASWYKVNSSWFIGAVTVNLFTHRVESLAHLDNTVNSNQDSVISNYRPRTAEEAGCDEVRHVSRHLVTTVALMQGFHSWASLYLSNVHGEAWVLLTGGNYQPKWPAGYSTTSPPMPPILLYTAQTYSKYAASNITTLEIKSLRRKLESKGERNLEGGKNSSEMILVLCSAF